MRAVAYRESLPIDHDEALLDVELPRPEPKGRDILVEVQAVSVNPVDTKVRKRQGAEPGEVKVLGYDAAGVVAAVGPDATYFKPGDEVFYAGTINRSGTNAQFHLVDERIVGRKPKSLDMAAAAALPLTSLTAWEMMFDRLDVKRRVPGAANALLIVGGAGGVGSIAIQLARKLTDLTVVATASRPETMEWAKELGAHHVIDHARPIAAEYAALGVGAPACVFATTHTVAHQQEIVELIAPQGRLGLIDDPTGLDVNALKTKSLSLHWELMFTRSLFETADMDAQHQILNHVSEMVDKGAIRTTMADGFGAITAANLKRAHAFIESGKARGKVVLAGWPQG
ncbi:zinc-binding alcohol dehydrogenase family protein [Aurantimonas sp. MSK8Z-1]|uniref:zinc-binding alcohol dehydrogenase family protein n=1 Tax=Mangrovibrevibacter kandeliae TaxID=2968473 RepID=UPI002117DC9E|nr:zinc-binding alcohol dehydrogenase family protein [Aurantimonas sp. MSK8Z-1]MCW4116575.1 zinc-binding alcohol dehydrogenase family protein [Aurantimonas sp. MSK8Z-1]